MMPPKKRLKLSSANEGRRKSGSSGLAEHVTKDVSNIVSTSSTHTDHHLNPQTTRKLSTFLQNKDKINLNPVVDLCLLSDDSPCNLPVKESLQLLMLRNKASVGPRMSPPLKNNIDCIHTNHAKPGASHLKRTFRVMRANIKPLAKDKKEENSVNSNIETNGSVEKITKEQLQDSPGSRVKKSTIGFESRQIQSRRLSQNKNQITRSPTSPVKPSASPVKRTNRSAEKIITEEIQDRPNSRVKKSSNMSTVGNKSSEIPPRKSPIKKYNIKGIHRLGYRKSMYFELKANKPETAKMPIAKDAVYNFELNSADKISYERQNGILEALRVARAGSVPNVDIAEQPGQHKEVVKNSSGRLDDNKSPTATENSDVCPEKPNSKDVIDLRGIDKDDVASTVDENCKPPLRCYSSKKLLQSTQLVSNNISEPNTFHVSFTYHSSLDELAKSVQWQVRLRLALNDTSKHRDCFPEGLGVRLNGSTVGVPLTPYVKIKDKRRRRGCILDITDWCKTSVESKVWCNSLMISWDPSEKPEDFCVSVVLAKKLAPEDQVQELKKFATRPPYETRALVKKEFQMTGCNAEYMIGINVSLICPLSQTMINLPCRTDNCTHLQCFDALAFFKMNSRKPKHRCPVCNKPAPFFKLVIDGLFTEILSAAPPTAQEVLFLQDASWTFQLPRMATNSISVGVNKQTVKGDNGAETNRNTERTIKHRTVPAKPSSDKMKNICPVEGCSFTFLNDTMLAMHNFQSHGVRDKRFKCLERKCLKPFKDTKDMMFHLKSHTGEDEFICNIDGCMRCFTPLERAVHARSHMRERPFLCPEQNCCEPLKDIDMVKKHMQNKHSDKSGHNEYRCHGLGCSETFSDYRSLATHFVIHIHEMPYMCHICEKVFEFLPVLSAHQFREHNQATKSPEKTPDNPKSSPNVKPDGTEDECCYSKKNKWFKSKTRHIKSQKGKSLRKRLERSTFTPIGLIITSGRNEMRQRRQTTTRVRSPQPVVNNSINLKSHMEDMGSPQLLLQPVGDSAELKDEQDLRRLELPIKEEHVEPVSSAQGCSERILMDLEKENRQKHTQQTETGIPDPQQTETGTPDPQQTETGTPDPLKTETGTPDPQQTETGTPDPLKTETVTLDPQQIETGTSDPLKTETGTPDPQQTETGTSDPLKTETGTSDPQKTETGTSELAEIKMEIENVYSISEPAKEKVESEHVCLASEPVKETIETECVSDAVIKSPVVPDVLDRQDITEIQGSLVANTLGIQDLPSEPIGGKSETVIPNTPDPCVSDKCDQIKVDTSKTTESEQPFSKIQPEIPNASANSNSFGTVVDLAEKVTQIYEGLRMKMKERNLISTSTSKVDKANVETMSNTFRSAKDFRASTSKEIVTQDSHSVVGKPVSQQQNKTRSYALSCSGQQTAKYRPQKIFTVDSFVKTNNSKISAQVKHSVLSELNPRRVLHHVGTADSSWLTEWTDDLMNTSNTSGSDGLNVVDKPKQFSPCENDNKLTHRQTSLPEPVTSIGSKNEDTPQRFDTSNPVAVLNEIDDIMKEISRQKKSTQETSSADCEVNVKMTVLDSKGKEINDAGPSICSKPQPKFVVICPLLEPTVLGATKSNQHFSMVVHFKMYLGKATPKDLWIACHLDQVHLRCFRIDKNGEREDGFPTNIKLTVNNTDISIATGKSPGPIDITSACSKEFVVENIVKVIWSAKQDYYLTVELVRAEVSLAEVQVKLLQENAVKPAQKSREIIRKILQLSNSLSISLICPLSKCRIQTPCRSVGCTHLECFDAVSYLDHNNKKAASDWKCPICGCLAQYFKLVIDGMFVRLLEAAPQGADKVMFKRFESESFLNQSVVLPSFQRTAFSLHSVPQHTDRKQDIHIEPKGNTSSCASQCLKRKCLDVTQSKIRSKLPRSGQNSEIPGSTIKSHLPSAAVDAQIPNSAVVFGKHQSSINFEKPDLNSDRSAAHLEILGSKADCEIPMVNINCDIPSSVVNSRYGSINLSSIPRKLLPSVCLARELSTDLLLLKETSTRPASEIKALIREKCKPVNGETFTIGLETSLLCPISKSRMSVPCKGSTCGHFQCFDALTYLKLNTQSQKWLCPLCGKKADFKNLIIDGLIEELLKEVPATEHRVWFNGNGSWSLYMKDYE